MLMLTNCVNFVVYFIFGRNFRQSFLALFAPSWIERRQLRSTAMATHYTSHRNSSNNSRGTPALIGRAKNGQDGFNGDGGVEGGDRGGDGGRNGSGEGGDDGGGSGDGNGGGGPLLKMDHS